MVVVEKSVGEKVLMALGTYAGDVVRVWCWVDVELRWIRGRWVACMCLCVPSVEGVVVAACLPPFVLFV